MGLNREAIERARRAALDLLDALKPGDEAAFVLSNKRHALQATVCTRSSQRLRCFARAIARNALSHQWLSNAPVAGPCGARFLKSDNYPIIK